MMTLESFFERIATPKLAFFALLVLIASTLIMGALSPEGKITPRIKTPYVAIGRTFGYESEPFYKMLDAFNTQADGEELKSWYRRFLYIDLIYPWFYGLAGAVLLAFLQKTINENTLIKTHYLWALPLLAALFDLGENISMLLVFRLYDGKPMSALLGFSQLMTMLKLIFISASFLLLIFVTIALIATGIKALIKVSKDQKTQQPVEQ